MNKIDLIIDALNKVIYACNLYNRQDIQDGGTVYLEDELEASIKALAAARELRALKPVAWVSESESTKQFVEGRPRRVWWECNTGVGKPFYTAPPRKEWVGLTDDEVYEIANFCKDQPFNFYAKEIQTKLNEKNT